MKIPKREMRISPPRYIVITEREKERERHVWSCGCVGGNNCVMMMMVMIVVLD